MSVSASETEKAESRAKAKPPRQYTEEYRLEAVEYYRMEWQPFLGHFPQRLRPAFLNSTGLMLPRVECILSLLYHHT